MLRYPIGRLAANTGVRSSVGERIGNGRRQKEFVDEDGEVGSRQKKAQAVAWPVTFERRDRPGSVGSEMTCLRWVVVVDEVVGGCGTGEAERRSPSPTGSVIGDIERRGGRRVSRYERPYATARTYPTGRVSVGSSGSHSHAGQWWSLSSSPSSVLLPRRPPADRARRCRAKSRAGTRRTR